MNSQLIPVRAVLGLKDREDEDWGELRALQLRHFKNGMGIRRGLMALLCPVLGIALIEIVPKLVVVSWVVLYCGITIGILLLNRKSRAPQAHTAQHREIWAAVGKSIIFGIFWMLATVMVLFSGADTAQISLGLTLSSSFTIAAMVVLTINLATLPTVPIVFNFMIALPVSAVYLWLDQPYLAFSFFAIATALSYFALRSGIAQLTLETAENRLQDKSETVSLLLREFEDTGADWLWQTDTGRCLIHVSPRFAHSLGYEAGEIEGKPILQLVAGDSWETGDYPRELHEFAEKLKKRQAFSNFILPIRQNGRKRWWELSASPRYGEEGEFFGFRGVGSDVTDQWESQEKIFNLARFDTLTALPNRLQVTEGLSEALSNADEGQARCAFMMLDLDRFKQVNDTLGHQIGDRLLAKVAKRLNQLMTGNELCGRLGGDEFAIVLKDARDDAYIKELAVQIITRLSQPYEVDQHTIYIGASIGSAIGPRDGHSVEMLMRSADLALYQSKEGGRGIHNSYQPQLHAQAEERRLMEIELRKALAQDEFTIVYQPVVHADDGMLVSFEALLRWNNDRYGDVPPSKFIPLAEEANLITPIGAWTLRNACMEAAQWPSHVRVAVNVSADQLMNGNFINTVVQALRDSGLPSHRLEIEVTESLFLRDGGVTARILDELRSLGVKLSLDDFGTGYSSLGYLRKTRFDTIKIDKSFVHGAAKKVPESIAIIRAVVAMADSLEMTTTAEGVETEQELELIRQLGCNKIQGYLFGRAMSFDKTMEMFATAVAQDNRELYRTIALSD